MECNWIDRFAEVWKQFKERVFNSEVKILDREEVSVWEDLFIGKILPHLEREGCLVIAIAGGTNTGKSTITNVLMKKEITATDYKAAATKRPVLIASERKARECLNNSMFLEFEAVRMENKEEAIAPSLPNNILLVKEEESLPDTYLYLDTPDIDSIAKEHWKIAEKIVSAGDIIVAVISDSKYKDDAVVKFFRRALEEGKIVIPIMNKVERDNPKYHQIAEEQIKDFLKEIGIQENYPCFYFPRWPYGENILEKPIKSFTDTVPDLREYIHSFPVQETKAQIMKKTIQRFEEELGRWYQNIFIESLNHLIFKVRYFEDYLENRIVKEKFVPFQGLRLLEDINYELRRQIGYFKYLIFFPTHIFLGHRSSFAKVIKDKEKTEIEIKQKHRWMIEECFNAFLDCLLKSELIAEMGPLGEKINERLHKLHTRREVLLQKIITEMEPLLSMKLEWMQKEIENIVSDILSSLNLYSLYGKRVLSLLLLGTGLISIVYGMPYMGPWVEILAGGGILSSAVFIDRIGHKEFQASINLLYEKWVLSKQAELTQILKAEVLEDVFQDIYKYIDFAEQFEEEVQKIFNDKFSLLGKGIKNLPTEDRVNPREDRVVEKH